MQSSRVFAKREWAFWLGLALVVLLVIGLCFFVLYESLTQRFQEDETPLEFTVEQWAQEPSSRHRMLDSLWRQYDGFEGMKQDEIRELLGEPSYASTYSGSSHDFYLVRSGKLLGPGTFLSIRYSADGTVLGFGLEKID